MLVCVFPFSTSSQLPISLSESKTLLTMKSHSFRIQLPILFAALLFITFLAFFSNLSNNRNSTSQNPWPFPNSSLGTTHDGRRLNESANHHQSCDLFKGKWVKEERKSYYDNAKCPSLQDSKDCFKYGREDKEFLHWRWKPDDDECDVPRFDPSAFLAMVRGTKMAFVGDSIARNQADSLACLLSEVEIPEVTYADKEDKGKTWFFQGHNFTISLLWTEFLVSIVEGPEYQPYTHSYNLHVDMVDPKWASKLPGYKYAIISTDHWWFRKNFVYKQNNLLGCYYCDQEKKNTTDVGLQFAYREAVKTALEFIANCKECGDLLAVLRTFSPAHFEAGTWDKGGECNRTSPLKEEEVDREGTMWELRRIGKEEVGRVRGEKGKKRRFELMDVTLATSYRADGHPGSHWVHKADRGTNDCVHWCLPGPIDVWNEMLMALMVRNSDLE